MWELLTWKMPWEKATDWIIHQLVQRGERPKIPPLTELPGFTDIELPETSINAYIALMNRCWAQDPAIRPDFKTVAAELRALQSA